MKKRGNKNKDHQRILASVLVVALAVLVLIVTLVCKNYADRNKAITELLGVWHYDQYTEYEFGEKGNGCICLDNSSHFEFTYKVEDDTLYLDFALDYVTDCQYTFSVDGEKLTLVGGEGTAEAGKVYELTKNK